MAPVKKSTLPVTTRRGARMVRVTPAGISKVTHQTGAKYKKLFRAFIAYPWVGADDSLDDVTSESDDSDLFDDYVDDFSDNDGGDVCYMDGVVPHVEQGPKTQSRIETGTQPHIKQESVITIKVEPQEDEHEVLVEQQGRQTTTSRKTTTRRKTSTRHKTASSRYSNTQRPGLLTKAGNTKKSGLIKARNTKRLGLLAKAGNNNNQNAHQSDTVHTHTQTHKNSNEANNANAIALEAIMGQAIQVIDQNLIALRDRATTQGGAGADAAQERQEQQASMIDRFYLPAEVLPVAGGEFADNRQRLARTYRMLVELEIEQIETAGNAEELAFALGLLRRQRLA